VADSHGSDAEFFGQRRDYDNYRNFFVKFEFYEHSAKVPDGFGYDLGLVTRESVYGRRDDGESVHRSIDFCKCRRPSQIVFDGGGSKRGQKSPDNSGSGLRN
jgi:hypothetical protein